LSSARTRPVERVVTSTIPFDDIVTRGFDALLDPATGQVKVIVEVG
jgi:(R,R)-butanediol dehydrogenase/meso-butanediol dehydrogenase/diacetyl reductase